MNETSSQKHFFPWCRGLKLKKSNVNEIVNFVLEDVGGTSLSAQ